MIVENVDEVSIPELRDKIWDVQQLPEFRNQQGTKFKELHS